MPALSSNIVLTGASGMLGQDLIKVLHKANFSVFGFNSNTMDIRDATAIAAAVSGITSIEFLVNCAAFTRVDDCESNEELAMAINAKGPENLAKFCHEKKIPIVHFSTDYVFDGNGDRFHEENDPISPINCYGNSKWLGEEAIRKFQPHHYIFRVQWLYGEHGNHFIKAMMNLSKSKKILDVVCDQWGTPTWTQDLAKWVLEFLRHRPPFGTYHLRADGITNWAEYAAFIFAETEKEITINRITSDQFQRPAKRPCNSRLAIAKWEALGFEKPRHWQDAAREFLKTFGENL